MHWNDAFNVLTISRFAIIIIVIVRVQNSGLCCTVRLYKYEKSFLSLVT